jgi:threonine dehydratase
MDAPGELPGTIVPVLTGGNIDPLLLQRVVQHGLVAAGRYLQISVRLDDKPGALASLLDTVAAAEGNIVRVDHRRTDTALEVSEVLVTLQLETKGPEHCTAVLDRLRRDGYAVS